MSDDKKLRALALKRFGEMYHNTNIKFGGWDKYHIPKEKKYFISVTCPFANFNEPFGVYWSLGKFHVPEYKDLARRYKERLDKICELLNSNQSLIRACREVDRVIDIKSTKHFIGKYFNY